VDALLVEDPVGRIANAHVVHFRGRRRTSDYYRSAGDKRVIRSMLHPGRKFLDLAVEDDHLAVEIFKCAKAKVAVLQENRRTNRTGVNAFDKGTGGRDLIKRAHFSSGRRRKPTTMA